MTDEGQTPQLTREEAELLLWDTNLLLLGKQEQALSLSRAPAGTAAAPRYL